IRLDIQINGNRMFPCFDNHIFTPFFKRYDYIYIKPARYFDNVMTLLSFERRNEIASIGRSVDKSKWYMTAATVNAYYNPGGNEIVFPAAILQPPFFHKDYPAW